MSSVELAAAMTMGSLFDGIGGFPLAAERYGIKTLWASEIEPFPMKVTGRRFPGMAHKGDITKLNGRLLLPVDRKSTRLNSSHSGESRMPSSA